MEGIFIFIFIFVFIFIFNLLLVGMGSKNISVRGCERTAALTMSLWTSLFSAHKRKVPALKKTCDLAQGVFAQFPAGTLWTGSSACCAYEENLQYRCASGVRVPREVDCWIITCPNSSSFTCKGTWTWWERDCKDNQKQDFCVILKGKANIDSRHDVYT